MKVPETVVKLCQCITSGNSGRRHQAGWFVIERNLCSKRKQALPSERTSDFGKYKAVIKIIIKHRSQISLCTVTRNFSNATKSCKHFVRLALKIRVCEVEAFERILQCPLYCTYNKALEADITAFCGADILYYSL